MQSAKQEGASLLTGGKRPPSQPKGYFVEPTVFTGQNCCCLEKQVARCIIRHAQLEALVVKPSVTIAAHKSLGLSRQSLCPFLRTFNCYTLQAQQGVFQHELCLEH